MHDQIAELLTSPEWGSLDQEGRQDELDKTAKATRAIARALIEGGKPAGKSAVPPIPPGFEMAPIPEGFELVK